MTHLFFTQHCITQLAFFDAPVSCACWAHMVRYNALDSRLPNCCLGNYCDCLEITQTLLNIYILACCSNSYRRYFISTTPLENSNYLSPVNIINICFCIIPHPKNNMVNQQTRRNRVAVMGTGAAGLVAAKWVKPVNLEI